MTKSGFGSAAGKRMLAAVLSVAMLATLLPFGMLAFADALNRPEDPVLLTGADIPSFASVLATNLVAFRYSNGSWVQVPVQVDERKVVSYGADVYNGVRGGYVTASYDAFENLVYCDTSTYVGADTNPRIDSDDEIVFMARDTGAQAPEGTEWPDGVKLIRGAEIAISDPLSPGAQGYLYFFERASDSALTSDAGVSYVSYDFRLTSGQTYKQAYPFTKAKNATQTGRPEDSSITTANYTYHFQDRWADDGLTITAGNATGVDILDRNKVAVLPSSQMPTLASLAGYGPEYGGSRTEDTFDGFTDDPAEGAFICNISGPVRAIRSYVGSNSGPITQRDYYAYDSRMDITTFLRVHAMPSLMSFFDYSAAAVGMKYYRDDTMNGVTVDGSTDNLSYSALSETELMTGAQGSLAMTTLVDHNMPSQVSFQSYYLDDASSSPKDMQFTGDAYAYGSSGVWLHGSISDMMTSMLPSYLGGQGKSAENAAEAYGIPATDPVRKSTAKSLTVHKTLRFRAPGMTYAEAQTATQETKNPLIASVNTIASPSAGDLETWTAVYNGNGAQMGSVPEDYEEHYEGSLLTLPGNTGGLARKGYAFLGWAQTPNATEPITEYADGVNGTVQFYAVWQRLPAYTEDGLHFATGAPAALFEDNFNAYADNTTASTLTGGKWASRAEATTDGAFSQVRNGKFMFQGRTSGSSGSSPRLGFSIDPSLVAGGNTVTFSCKIRTGSTGKTQLSLYAGNSAVVSPIITLENGVATAKGSSTSVAYTPSTGTNAATDGDQVPVTVVMDFASKKFSAYANGQVLTEDGSLTGIGENTDLLLMLHGNYAMTEAGTNWGEYDDVVLRQAGIAVTDLMVRKNNTVISSMPASGTIEVSRTLYNELPTDFAALMAIGVYDQAGKLTQIKLQSVNALARSKVELNREITLVSGDAFLRVFFWKDMLNIHSLLEDAQFPN